MHTLFAGSQSLALFSIHPQIIWWRLLLSLSLVGGLLYVSFVMGTKKP